MKKVMVWLSMLWEILKSFLLMVIVICAIILAFGAILHNTLKIREIYAEDTTGYKNLVNVDENRLNVQVTGSGDQTIVILANFGTSSPIVEYKTYVNELASSYRVVVIEYFGYGFSLSTTEERTTENFVHEIKTALEQSGVGGSYTLLANGTSALYAMQYTYTYASSVDNLILIDPVYPESIEEDYVQKLIKDEKFNITLTSFAELTGYARLMSYVYPEMFGIDKLEEYGFDKSDIKLYRKMIANRFYTKTMRNEYKKLAENMEGLQNYTLPSYLPTLQILSEEYVDEYEEYKEDNLISQDLEEYADNIVTNYDIQDVVIIDDGVKNNMNIYNPSEVISAIRNWTYGSTEEVVEDEIVEEEIAE